MVKGTRDKEMKYKTKEQTQKQSCSSHLKKGQRAWKRCKKSSDNDTELTMWKSYDF